MIKQHFGGDRIKEPEPDVIMKLQFSLVNLPMESGGRGTTGQEDHQGDGKAWSHPLAR